MLDGVSRRGTVDDDTRVPLQLGDVAIVVEVDHGRQQRAVRLRVVGDHWQQYDICLEEQRRVGRLGDACAVARVSEERAELALDDAEHLERRHQAELVLAVVWVGQ